LDSIYSGVTGFTDYTFVLTPVVGAQFDVGHLSELRVEVTSAAVPVPEPSFIDILGFGRNRGFLPSSPLVTI